jgi:hypothetical protein
MKCHEILLSSAAIAEMLPGYESSACFVQCESRRWAKAVKFSGVKPE